jgi:hypothetical protein
MDTIIEEAPVVPHVSHCPFEHRVRQLNVPGVEFLTFEECNNSLRDTMDVYGIATIVKIFNFAIRPKKTILIEPEPSLNT